MSTLDSPASVRAALRTIAGNFWFSWGPGARALFEDLDPERFEALDHNPTALVNALSDEQLGARATPEYLGRLQRVLVATEAEARRSTSCRRNQGDDRFGVACFSCEFGLDERLPIYSAGLGVLAGAHLTP